MYFEKRVILNVFQYSGLFGIVLHVRLWAGLAGSRAELAPSCLEQSDKLNATPTNTSVLLLLYTLLAFSNYFLRWKPPLSRPALPHNGYKGPPVSARAQMDFPKFPNGFLWRPIVISSPQFSRGPISRASSRWSPL